MDDGGPTEPRRLGRAAFLGVTAAGLSSLAWGAAAWNGVHGLATLLPDGVRQALPAPTSGWRIYTVAASMPRFDPSTWRLHVDGLVEEPLALTLDDLRALPRAEQVSDFHCVTGWSVSGVRWGGVRLRDVLAPARPRGGAIAFVSAERPYVDSLTTAQASLPDVMLAFEMDGRPLPRVHGAPLRLVIPEMFGYKNVKWVERLTVTPGPELGYWERRGYDRDAWVGRSNGR